MSSELASSKSLLLRALIVQSYFPSLKIQGHSECEDVQHIRQGLADFKKGKGILDCGEGGAPLRFMALRVSREKGTYWLKGSPRLLSRPQGGLLSLLKQLGVQAELKAPQGLYIQSQGWQAPQKPLQLEMHQSSQFASALLLNSWQLDFNLKMQAKGKIRSQGYWKMTCQMLQKMGMEIETIQAEEREQNPIERIKAGQSLKISQWHGEVDMDQAFAW